MPEHGVGQWRSRNTSDAAGTDQAMEARWTVGDKRLPYQASSLTGPLRRIVVQPGAATGVDLGPDSDQVAL